MDCTTPQNPAHKNIGGPMSDSLDACIGHNASDPGSIDGIGLEKQHHNGLSNTKKNAKVGKNQNRQNTQQSSAMGAVEEKPKYSWSEHVWSKSHFS